MGGRFLIVFFFNPGQDRGLFQRDHLVDPKMENSGLPDDSQQIPEEKVKLFHA
jgi:hypothetical protein